MMNPFPKKLEHQHRGLTNYESEKEALLNISDKKLNNEFTCKNPIKTAGGFGSMLMGAALGLVAAVAVAALIISGPIGWAVLATAAVVGAVGVGSVVYSVVSAMNQCDKMIESASWKFYHSRVYIDKKNALLQTSTLTCSGGGIISVVPDAQRASAVASAYSEYNNKEADKHIGAQAVQGFISGLSSLGSPIGMAVGTVFGSYTYFSGDADFRKRQMDMLNETQVAERTYLGDLESSAGDEAIGQGIGTAVGVGEGVTEKATTQQGFRRSSENYARQSADQYARAGRLASNGAAQQSEEVARRALHSRWASEYADDLAKNTKFNWKAFGGGVAAGLLAGFVNASLENLSNTKEEEYFDHVLGELRDLRKVNNSDIQGVNIVATTK